MKSKKIGIVLVIFLLMGSCVFVRMLIQRGHKQELQNLVNKGTYLVSLLALYPTKDFSGERRDFFLRTLTEYVSSEGLAYYFVHDHTGNTLASLAPDGIAAKIPNEIRMRSLYTLGLTKETFTINGSKCTFYEFAKPKFANGVRSGTVRLGLKFAPTSFFSFERVSVMAMVAFCIFAAVSFTYYGITLALRPLKDLNQNFQNTCFSSNSAVANSATNGGVSSIVQECEHSLARLKERLSKIESENTVLAGKIGVVSFEKNQIINILDSINFGVMITDIQDNLTYANAHMLNLMSKERSELIDRSLDAIFEQEDMTSFVALQQAIKQATDKRRIAFSLPDLAPGNSYEVSLSYLKDGEGTLTGQMIFVEDVTGQQMAEKARHEFITHAAHEFLTPLATIRSYSEMLMDGEIDDSELKEEFYNTISVETNRLARLIENLLNISKIEAGSLTLDKTLVRTDSLVADCITALETPANEKDITIERNLPDKFPTLVGDKELLKVAIINILGNAVKYCPTNCHITLALDDEEEAVTFNIIDNGHGISREDLPHIFEKSYRSADPNIAAKPGSGLGLAIAAEIVRLHGGDIQVRSEPGDGTHFALTIPKEEYHLAKQ